MSQHKGPPELCLDCARDRARAALVYSHDSYERHRNATLVLAALGLDRLIELAEADPDVADTAWAIIAHHHKHRTGG